MPPSASAHGDGSPHVVRLVEFADIGGSPGLGELDLERVALVHGVRTGHRLVVEDDVVDQRTVVLPFDDVAHLSGHRGRLEFQGICLAYVDAGGYTAHRLRRGTAGWGRAAEKSLVVRIRHGVDFQEHGEVIQPAELIALAEVLAWLAGLDPAAVLKAGLGVDLPSQAWHPEGMEHVFAHDLHPHDLAARGGPPGALAL